MDPIQELLSKRRPFIQADVHAPIVGRKTTLPERSVRIPINLDLLREIISILEKPKSAGTEFP